MTKPGKEEPTVQAVDLAVDYVRSPKNVYRLFRVTLDVSIPDYGNGLFHHSALDYMLPEITGTNSEVEVLGWSEVELDVHKKRKTKVALDDTPGVQ